METAKELRKTALRLPIIFTTTEPEFSLEGYEVHPLDYLLKPVDPSKLDWCLQELREFWAVRFLLNFRRAPARERLLPRGVWRSMISVMRKNRGIFF